jgi:thioredoxin-related protein
MRLLLTALALASTLTAQQAQDASLPAFDLTAAAAKAARSGKILMLRFEPSGEADLANLDKVIAADADLAATFGRTFQITSLTVQSKDAIELNQKLDACRGTWPGVALVDKSGALLSVVDAASWKTDGKWDAARLKGFVAFWTPQKKGEAPKSNRLKDLREKYGEIYNPAADASADIAAAVQQAKAEGKHVLVKVGFNGCPWCYFLHDELEQRPELRKYIENDYVLVRMNCDAKNKNDKMMAELGQPGRFGYPVLVVLDGEGKRLHTQDSGLLETGDHHDPKQVKSFLEGWTPKALKGR